MSSIVRASTSESNTTSLHRKNADPSSKSENSAGPCKTTAVKKASPFSAEGATAGVGLTRFLSAAEPTTSLNSVSANASNGDSGPTAPIQPIIDLLFKSDFMSEINQGFMIGLKEKDRAFESIDVVKDPQNYTAEQKLIMYLDLLQTKATFEKYKDNLGYNRGIDNDREIQKDLDKAISILGTDQDVNSLITKLALKAFKLIFSGSRVTPPDIDKDPFAIINDTITRDEKMKDLRQRVEDAFERDIVNGGLLNDGLNAGKDAALILREYNAALGFYSMVLPDDFCKQRLADADATYAEFFDKNVLPTISDPTTALDGLIRMGLKGEKTERELKGLGSVLPVVVSDQLLGRGGSLFPDLNIDLGGLKKVSSSEFGSTVRNNVTHLFNPTIKAMANQFYSGTENADARAEFKADVKALLGPLLDKIAAGEIEFVDLGGNLARITSKLTAPGGKEAWGYRHAVQTALEGLVMGASLVSKMPANPEFDKSLSPLPFSNLATYSFNDVMAMIMIGTGLAGKGIAANGGSAGGFFPGSRGDAWIAERMFGTNDNAWSKTIQGLDLSYIDSEYLTNSLKNMGLAMSGLMKTLMPRIDVIEPIVIDGKTAEDAIKKIIAPSLDALAETLFKGNAGAMVQYKMNFTMIFAALWATMRPGGTIESIRTHLAKLIDKTATSAPAGVDPVKYKAALASGVMSVLTASRSIYAGLDMTKPTWDSVGVVVLHALGALVHMSNALGSAIKSSNFSLLEIGHFAAVSDDLARAQRSVLSAFFKNTGTIVGTVTGVAWLPVDYYQFLKGLTSGNGDPVDLIFMGVGTAADTIGAIGGLAGLGNMLVNSTFLGRTGAAIALPSGFSLAFSVAGAVSWGAWAGYTIYQSIKQEKTFHKQTDMMDDMLKRTVNDTVGIYANIGPIVGKGHVNPAPREPEQRELTPENWEAITADVEKRRGKAIT
ncbi:hypothetical protein GOD71_27045 [Sinorhizobium medicae]|uniref:hypothetical protein n=2 Tax=Rhizobium meliloti TaxID=382 RepID=UPI0012977BF9|nr:hypothetical protein [Sinorhizobium medicae]MQX64084.1 hypothetical protein [Sinorhizobium meliloti]